MRRLLVILLCVMLIPVSALSEATDFSSLTDDELHALEDGARNELTKRELIAKNEAVLFAQDGVTVYLTGENRITDGGFLYLGVIAVNESDVAVSLLNDQASVNGWMSFMNGIGTVSSGKKAMKELQFNLNGTGVTELEQLQEIEVSVSVFDMDNAKMLYTTDLITVHFSAD